MGRSPSTALAGALAGGSRRVPFLLRRVAEDRRGVKINRRAVDVPKMIIAREKAGSRWCCRYWRCARRGF